VEGILKFSPYYSKGNSWYDLGEKSGGGMIRRRRAARKTRTRRRKKTRREG